MAQYYEIAAAAVEEKFIFVAVYAVPDDRA